MKEYPKRPEPDFLICVMNHHSRDITELLKQLDQTGYPYRVFTDNTDYYKTRDKNRYKGVKQNLFNILKYETDYFWKLVIHDDIVTNTATFDSIKHVLGYAPKKTITFYNPQNKAYNKALAMGHHVLKTYHNWWGVAIAYPQNIVDMFFEWSETYQDIVWNGKLPEDYVLENFYAMTETPVYTILPSLTQHGGWDTSTFKNPPKAGGYYRYSAAYDPEFDVTQVEWFSEFAYPYLDLQRKIHK